MKNHKKDLQGVKSTLRTVEGLLEIGLLALLYYVVWRQGYEKGVFPAYHGNGKYVLAGVYALLCVALFWNFEGFRFGYLKTTDVLVSQCIALVIINFITYWQLCLIANVMISPLPILTLMVIDAAIALVCSFLYNLLYHRIYPPKNMVMIFGNDNAIDLKFKMDTRSDKYRITKLINS